MVVMCKMVVVQFSGGPRHLHMGSVQAASSLGQQLLCTRLGLFWARRSIVTDAAVRSLAHALIA